MCRESTDFSLLQNKRHNRWTSARELRLCIGVLGVSAAGAQVMLYRGFEAWLTPPRGWWASPTLQTAAGAPTCAFPFGPCLCALRPSSGSCCMLGSGARLVPCDKLQSRCASTCSATNEVCQYYQSALCGSNFLVCCVLLWPRMPQLLPTTVFGLQGRF